MKSGVRGTGIMKSRQFMTSHYYILTMGSEKEEEKKRCLG